MRLVKRLFKFYLNSSVHVALAVLALSWITLIKFDLPFDKAVLYFIFYASITGYNFVKYFGLAKFHRRQLANWLKAIQFFSLICFILMFFYAFQLETTTILIIAGFGAITFMYAIPFLPKRFFVDKQNNLRSISGLKVYVIALVWSGVTVLLPLINEHYEFTNDVLVTCVQRFVFILALMLPFELRDLKYDSLKLGTIPQKIGVKRTKMLGVLLCLLFFFMEFFKSEIEGRQIIILLLVSFVLILFTLFSRREQSDIYTAFWVEGIPIFWLFLEVYLLA
ncbi:hypothetical protein [Formosa sp. S-31]|uniref:hypothetical protein n=1 Tax=Formosa sp. S-31 TaxID=2790949 RepID=UPI003EBFA908